MSFAIYGDPFFGIVPSFRDMRRELRRMDRELNRVLSSEDNSNSSSSSTNEAVVMWSPTCDVTETDKEVIVHADLPGVPKENINIEVKDNVLTISGERKQENRTENEKWHRIERTYGRFSRSMAVPEGINQENIRAKFENGVLQVSFPKPQEVNKEPKKITIN